LYLHKVPLILAGTKGHDVTVACPSFRLVSCTSELNPRATLIAALLSLRNARVKYRRALPLPGWSLVKNKFLVQSTEAGKWLLRLALSISMLVVVLVCGVYIYEAVK
jgi:hypothetical protein